MSLSKSNLPLEFPQPTRINTLVCCDLDETYIPYSIENRNKGGIKELEKFMLEKGYKKGILIGWITGTNLSSALRKANNYISYSPHFLCCSLGTEFYWIKNGKLIQSESWKDRIVKSGFSHENVNTILEKISEKGILLQRQPDDYQGPYKISFYYYIRKEMEADFNWIKNLTAQYHIRVIFTKCNPAAGDPEDCYDVEFIPTCCGKDQAVLFLKDELNLIKENILAFGDSANDFSMFANSGKGYLVSNADKTAIDTYGSSLNHPYCHGILDILKEIK